MRRWRGRSRRRRPCRPRCAGERRSAQAPRLIEPAVKSLDAALAAIEDARAHLDAALRAADHDPRELEKIEERLFALRAARKYNVPVDELKALAVRHAADLGLIEAGAERLAALEASAGEAREPIAPPRPRCPRPAARHAERLDQAVNAELKPLRLDGRSSPPRSPPSRKRPARTASTASSSGCAPIPAPGRGR